MTMPSRILYYAKIYKETEKPTEWLVFILLKIFYGEYATQNGLRPTL